MIATVLLGNSDVEHTLNTLGYTDRVKQRGGIQQPGQAMPGLDDMFLRQALEDDDDLTPAHMPNHP
jgi:hypothetical protein